MAVRDHLTEDGLNLADLPAEEQGVTCYFCHSTSAVRGTHNNPLELAGDRILRGPLNDAIETSAHASAYDKLHDRNSLASASLCGGCHDIQTTQGVDVERTFHEWQGSFFSQAPGGTTCSQCHMQQSTALEPIATAGNAPLRRRHAHDFPGVDLALTDFPFAEQQKAKIEDLLGTTLQSALCVRGFGKLASLVVVLDNVAAGHNWPSGAAQDRRAWVELTAYQAGQVIYRSGGPAPDGSAPNDGDPDLWLLRDRGCSASSKEVALFWQARSVQTATLPAPVAMAADPSSSRSHVFRTFPVNGSLPKSPDKVTMQVHLAPIGSDVVRTLIESGDLDPSVLSALATLNVGEPLTWTAESATETYLEAGLPMSCISTSGLLAAADRVPAAAAASCSQ
jgi:hypothetical protein